MTMHAGKTRSAGWLGVARIAGRLGLALVIALAGYLLIYRPQQLRWGATDEEVARAMPGDEIQLHPIFNATRAVTINARPEQIWPWLVQIGYQRAGWYGYNWIDNDGLPSADRIIPQLQHLKVGDEIPILKGTIFKVVAVEPNRSLVWASEDGHYSMVLALYPIDASHTRLVWRVHGAYNWTSPSVVIPQLFSDLSDLIAVRQNMLGIKERAEGVAPEAPAVTYTELALWVATFLGFLVAEAGLVVRRDWLRPLLAVSATGLITVGLVLLKPPIWVDGLATIGVLAGLWWMYRPAARKAVPGTGKRVPGEMR
jgi:preprotein translocase subunit YajC